MSNKFYNIIKYSFLISIVFILVLYTTNQQIKSDEAIKTKYNIITFTIINEKEEAKSYKIFENQYLFDVLNDLNINYEIYNLENKIINDNDHIYLNNKILKDKIIYETKDSNLININTASKEQLLTLEGIGEVTAKKIIEYRNIQKFNSIEEIMNIEGIGEKTYEKLKKFITI